MGVPQLSVYSQGIGAFSADWADSVVQGGAKLADLRAFPGMSNMTVWMIGTTVAGDGGQGMFVWNAAATANDDNGITTIAPPGAATGRWIRQSSGLATLPQFPNIAALRANALIAVTNGSVVEVLGYYTLSDGGDGLFAYNAADVTSPDNSGTIIVDTLNQRWYRQFSSAEVTVLWFGAKGDGVTNDTAAIQAALAFSLAVRFPVLETGAKAVYLITAVLTLRVGHHLTGDGAGGSVINATTASQTVFSFTSASLVLARISIADMQIEASAAGVIGISTVLASSVTFNNLEFIGCEGDCIRVDRGYFALIDACSSRPNPVGSRKAGAFHCNSTDDANYCFYPTLRNCVTNTGEEVGISVGVLDKCVWLRRVIQGNITNFQAERLDLPTPNLVDGIWIENDCQGVKIIGGSSHGAKFGIVLFPGTGPNVAPGFCEIIDHDVDVFTQAGISLSGTVLAALVDIEVQDCVITAPQGSAVGINASHIIRLTIESNTIDQYGAQGGSGIQIGDTNSAQIVGNAINNMTTGIGLAGTANVNMVASDNIVTNCVNAFLGDATAGGVGTNAFRQNRGINPFTVITPVVPGSGGTVTNTTGFDVMVYPVGGTTVQWSVNGRGLGLATGGFWVPANGTISITYVAPPTWAWVGN